MVQMSWTFVNDSLCTTLCLQWEPEIIAIAVMYLAAKLSKFEVIYFCIKDIVPGFPSAANNSINIAYLKSILGQGLGEQEGAWP